jgi:RNA polymerase sigma-70 factor (ECF subfamily)
VDPDLETRPVTRPPVAPAGLVRPDDADASPARLSGAVARHHALVWRTLRRFGVAEADVDDAAQRVLLTFAERMAQVDTAKEAAFLVSVAVRVAANTRRKIGRTSELLVGDFDAVAADGVSPQTPETLLDQKQAREQLDGWLLTLPLEQRAVFVLFEIEGFALREIAEALSIPIGTATSRLRRARVRFEAWVSGYEHPCGDYP